MFGGRPGDEREWIETYFASSKRGMLIFDSAPLPTSTFVASFTTKLLSSSVLSKKPTKLASSARTHAVQDTTSMSSSTVAWVPMSVVRRPPSSSPSKASPESHV